MQLLVPQQISQCIAAIEYMIRHGSPTTLSHPRFRRSPKQAPTCPSSAMSSRLRNDRFDIFSPKAVFMTTFIDIIPVDRQIMIGYLTWKQFPTALLSRLWYEVYIHIVVTQSIHLLHLVHLRKSVHRITSSSLPHVRLQSRVPITIIMRFSITIIIALVFFTVAFPKLQERDPFCSATLGNPCDPTTEKPCCRDDNSLMTCAGTTDFNGDGTYWLETGCSCAVLSGVSCCSLLGNACDGGQPWPLHVEDFGMCLKIPGRFTKADF